MLLSPTSRRPERPTNYQLDTRTRGIDAALIHAHATALAGERDAPPGVRLFPVAIAAAAGPA